MKVNILTKNTEHEHLGLEAEVGTTVLTFKKENFSSFWVDKEANLIIFRVDGADFTAVLNESLKARFEKLIP